MKITAAILFGILCSSAHASVTGKYFPFETKADYLPVISPDGTHAFYAESYSGYSCSYHSLNLVTGKKLERDSDTSGCGREELLISPDSKLIADIIPRNHGDDLIVEVLDAKSLSQLATYTFPMDKDAYPYQSAAFSPDSSRLVVVPADSPVGRLIDIESGVSKPVDLSTMKHGALVHLRRGVQFSKDGKMLVVADNNLIRAFNGKTGALLWEAPLGGEDGNIHVHFYLGDSRVLVVAGTHSFDSWDYYPFDAKTGKSLYQFGAFKDWLGRDFTEEGFELRSSDMTLDFYRLFDDKMMEIDHRLHLGSEMRECQAVPHRTCEMYGGYVLSPDGKAVFGMFTAPRPGSEGEVDFYVRRFDTKSQEANMDFDVKGREVYPHTLHLSSDGKTFTFFTKRYNLGATYFTGVLRYEVAR